MCQPSLGLSSETREGASRRFARQEDSWEEPRGDSASAIRSEQRSWTPQNGRGRLELPGKCAGEALARRPPPFSACSYADGPRFAFK